MSERIVLDSTPLSLLSHPKLSSPGVAEINRWLREQLDAGAAVFIPEIADYEVRRELLRAGKVASLKRLDSLRDTLIYLPLDTPTIRRAAEMWALARQQGTPTADPREIDADVILAAQAEKVGAIVATDNVGHLSLFVPARHWRDIGVSSGSG